MYAYTWDKETGGLLLNSSPLQFSKEPRPVYWRELDLLGFNEYWQYPHDDSAPIMWAEANNYIYRGKIVAKIEGGSCYTPPKIVEIDPLIEKQPLETVNINKMIERNRDLLAVLEDQTIRTTYNTYLEYKKRVDVFHVSYSGGKDSEVCLDIVQRAIPHNDFVVIFGDTKMEFPDTYDSVKAAMKRCEESTSEPIKFYTAESIYTPQESWSLFGPPSSAIRWCCTVHKTAPQLLKLREVVGSDCFVEMAFVGVRASESIRRSEYDMISYGMKHKGQYSFYPILQWNSAEVYLYLYARGLPINAAYKKGVSRAGCAICPLSASKNNYFNRVCYPSLAKPFLDCIRDTYEPGNKTPQVVRSYIENVGWKARKSGRDLSLADRLYTEEDDGNNLKIYFVDKKDSWREWIKTLGTFYHVKGCQYKVTKATIPYLFEVIPKGNQEYLVTISSFEYKKETDFLKNFRRVFRKAHFCVGCQVCQANCKFGNLKISKTKITIANSCIHCGDCLDIDTGCLVYKSLWYPKNKGKMKTKSIDCYMTHPIRLEWINQYISLGDEFKQSHSLGNNQISIFKRFLRDSGLINAKGDTILGSMLKNRGIEDVSIWALILVNLAHSPQIGWFIRTFGFGEVISQKQMKDILSMNPNVGKASVSYIPNTIRKMVVLPIGKLGMAQELGGDKQSGFRLIRQPNSDLDSRVLLYSLYKYAEACGDFKQFTMSRLYDDTVDSDGVSPVRIFGIEEEEMEKMLKGLSMSNPEFINVSFTHDLDNITLNDEKTSEDVLSLF